MTRIRLGEPEWPSLAGGSTEIAWMLDRDRKISIAAGLLRRVKEVATALSDADALLVASPQVLRGVPFAADWYVSLAGYALKTLGNIKEGPRRHGMRRQAKGFLTAMRANPKKPKDAEVEAFCKWVNGEIAHNISSVGLEESDAAMLVALVLGGRAVGQGQNISGNDAVLVVKVLMLQMGQRIGVEIGEDGHWRSYAEGEDIRKVSTFRFGRRLVCDFAGGGNRPDLIASIDEEVVAVAEIKGRKDLSNAWESWMPQSADHMRTWAREFPEAVRLFFATVITDEMISGRSSGGTERTGLRGLYGDGLLTGAYNISKTLAADPASAKSFSELSDQFENLVANR